MSGYTRQVPVLGASRKRKGRDGSDVPVTPKAELGPAPLPSSSAAANNQLLAGYLAHEFLTQGTIFGQRWDPARSKPAARPIRTAGPDPGQAPTRAYSDVACLMKTDGAHIPGVVNPTQLGRWLRM